MELFEAARGDGVGGRFRIEIGFGAGFGENFGTVFESDFKAGFTALSVVSFDRLSANFLEVSEILGGFGLVVRLESPEFGGLSVDLYS